MTKEFAEKLEAQIDDLGRENDEMRKMIEIMRSYRCVGNNAYPK